MSRRKNKLLEETKSLCAHYGIKPSKRYGQNFLINELIYPHIIESADLSPGDTVLEVGPGLGFLTFTLAEAVKEVVAVEIDPAIASILPERLHEMDYGNAKVSQGNILDFPRLPGLDKFTEKPYKIVANLPYNITNVFLRKFLEQSPRPVSLTLMLQREVAKRICARPGDLSVLALSVRFYGEPQYMFDVDKSDFYPEPNVNSAVIHIKTKPEPSLPAEDARAFWRLVKVGFSAKRKMLKKNLANAFPLDASDFARILEQNKLNPLSRAQDLSLDDWLKLFALLKRDVL